MLEVQSTYLQNGSEYIAPAYSRNIVCEYKERHLITRQFNQMLCVVAASADKSILCFDIRVTSAVTGCHRANIWIYDATPAPGHDRRTAKEYHCSAPLWKGGWQ